MSSVRYLGDLAGLRARIDGELITPADSGFGSAVRPWNLAFQHHPALIVRARTTDDVVAAVQYARRSGLTVSVQATGHGVSSVVAGGLMILTSQLDRVEVDPDRGIATVGSGSTWAPVLSAAQIFGLAPVLGSSPRIGAVGYTLGGGFGWLARRYGLAADHVRSFTVVLADGSVVVASLESEPELFWALRGAGMGSLGVVVEMEIGLVPVAMVYGGNLLYPVDTAAEVFDRYASWSEALPAEFTSAFAISTFPLDAAIAEPLRGRSFAIVRGCHCGDLDEGVSLVNQIRSWRRPAVDTFGSMPFNEVAGISQDPVDPVAVLTTARWLTGLSNDVVTEMYDVVMEPEGSAEFLFAETRHAGGAMNGLRSDASYTPPEADRLLQVVAATPDDEARSRAMERIQRLWTRLGPRVDSVFLNMTEGEERIEQSRNAFDFSSWDRLVALASRIDPDHLFAHGIDFRSDQLHRYDKLKEGNEK